ncbi:MAG: mechanosensitive ion channel family protein [Proteobacteria bacterium]|nr:mechanosensitive ion channel family protein [Pseudomonadota bacterium]
MSSTSRIQRACRAVGIALALALLAPPVIAAKQTPARAPASSAGKSSGTSVQPALTKPAPLLPLTAGEVLNHVRRSVSWYSDLTDMEQLSLPDVSPAARGQLQKQALAAVRLAFEFGKAAEDILGRESRARSAGAAKGAAPAAAQSAAPTLAAQLARAAASLASREAALKSQMAALDARLRRTRGAKARAALTSERAGLLAALQLLQQIDSNIGQLRRFQESAIIGQGRPPKGLRAQLAALEKSVPELSAGVAPAGEAVPAPGAAHPATAGIAPKSSAANFQPQSAGIVPLIGQWFTLHRYRGQTESAIGETNALQSELSGTRSRLLATVRGLVGGGMASITAGNTAQLAAQRQTIEAATTRLRELSSVLVPLGEQALTLSSAQSTLEDWSHTVAAQQSSVASYIGLRVGLLLGWVAAVLVISEIWRRVTYRYLPDARRRRPLLVLRRLVVGIALTLVVLFTLISQVGSLATYVGFVTAGIAVALSNVILAMVAYFFLIGRYGVRVGDRVTISGVTGRVVDVSLLRIYLMELSGPDLHSTGRMVVLSNAVLFQPTALFKQIPGAEYLWHSVTLTIIATADVEEAYKRLQAAASKVYDTYRAGIESQHALAQRFIEFDTAAPAPEVRVRLTDTGLECTVRYPVMPERAARVDQEMLDVLRKAVERDEQLKLVASGGMVLKSSES